MKKLLHQMSNALPLMALALSFSLADAQEIDAPMGIMDYQTTIQNVIQTSDRTLEFDIYLLDTDPSNSSCLARFQAGITLNPDIYSGGTLTSTIVSCSSELNNQDMEPVSTQYTGLAPYIIKLYPRAIINNWGSDISAAYPGTRVSRIKLTSSVPFATNSRANLSFLPSTATYPFFGTIAGFYFGTYPSAIEIKMGVNAFVLDNPLLNPDGSVVAYSVTGSGEYCQGEAGLTVGISNSQRGVNYTLIKNGIATGDVIPGTGSAVSFGTRPFGNYTIEGNADGSVPGISGTNSMTGSALITESLTIDASVSISVSQNNVCPWTQVIFTAAPIGGGTSPSYEWFKNNELVSTSDTYQYDINQNGDIVYVVMTSGLRCTTGPATSNAITMSVNSSSVVPVISGPANVNVHSTGNVYTTDPGMNNYQWNVSAGGVITSGGTPGSNSVTITWNAGQNQSVSVNYDNACATWNPSTYYVNVTDHNLDFQTTIRNIVQTSDHSLEFDVYLLDTDPTEPMELAAFQGAFHFNPAIYAIDEYWFTPSIVPGTSSLSNSAQIPTFVRKGLDGPGEIMLFPQAPPCAGYGSVISQVSPGTRITRLKISTAGYPFVSNTTPDFIVQQVIERYVNFNPFVELYVDGIRTQVPVIMGENGFVLENPVLNPSPFATQWTGAAKGINSNDWFDSGNWDNGVPGAITDVTIPGGLTNYPTILSHYPPASCASITIGDGGSFIGAEYLTTGIATVKRTISDTRAHFLSSPVSSNTFGNVFANSMSVWARWWNPLAESWDYRTSSNMFAIGTGYNVSTTTPGVTANYTGELNCTDVTLSLSNANGGWNLLGNPYPSAIDWDEVFKDDGISGSVAAWNGTNYIYWNGTTGSLTDGIIQAVNGFFVSTTINGSTLTIPLSARVHNPAPILKETVPYVLKLRVNGNTASDETFIHFNDNATAAYDNLYDARKLWGEDFAPQLYSMIEGDVLAINELPFDGNKTIDLGFRCNTNGEYILNASGIESFEDSTLILLEDLKNNKLQDLRNEPVYNFKYQAGDNAGRFKLHFRTQSADNDPDNSGISVYSYDHNIILTNTTGIEGKVTVYDMTGREIISTNISNQVTTSIPMLQAVTGYYVLKIFTAKTNVIQKVFIQ